MLIADILHSCRDHGIAAAAVASIGGPLAAEITAEAARADLSPGAFAASLVRGFAAEATERDWRDLMAAIARADQPVLSGVRFIAEGAMARRARPASRPHPRDLRPSLRPAAAAPCCLA